MLTIQDIHYLQTFKEESQLEKGADLYKAFFQLTDVADYHVELNKADFSNQTQLKEIAEEKETAALLWFLANADGAHTIPVPINNDTYLNIFIEYDFKDTSFDHLATISINDNPISYFELKEDKRIHNYIYANPSSDNYTRRHTFKPTDFKDE